MDTRVDSAISTSEFVISRVFQAPRERVWRAWTERDQLMKWFCPEGYTMTRAKLDLRTGGTFHYAQVSPDGQTMWGKWTFREIAAPERLVVVASFSDEEGGITRHPLAAKWPLEMLSTTTLKEKNGKTTLTIQWAPLYATNEELKTFTDARDDMQQGWTGTLDKLDAYLASDKEVASRVSTYLNFPRTTEAAFLFYKYVFRSEFAAPIARFGDIPPSPGQPPVAEADKNLVMHVELPILGGHILMGTDAPDSMGFKLKAGNNIYINLEPDTRGETDRLFRTLSEGGKVEMPLQEMFWGGYFGSLTDKFGINWMFNCRSKS